MEFARLWNNRALSLVTVPGFRKEADQAYAIPIGRSAPIGAEGFEFETGLIIHLPGDDCVAIFDTRLNLLPDVLAYASRIRADVDTCTYLKQPDSQPAP